MKFKQVIKCMLICLLCGFSYQVIAKAESNLITAESKPIAIKSSKIIIETILDNYRGELTVIPSVDEVGQTFDWQFSGTLKLFDKKSNKLAQQFRIPYLTGSYFESFANMKPLVRVKSLDHFNTNLRIEDFNFDGIKDLAIPMNNDAGYLGTQYDIYIYNKQRKKYLRNNQLSKLIAGQGVFQIDQKKKLFIVYAKSGCCWHMEERYKVTPRGVAVKVYERIDDQTKSETPNNTSTIKKLINNRWVIKVKEFEGDDQPPEDWDDIPPKG